MPIEFTGRARIVRAMLAATTLAFAAVSASATAQSLGDKPVRLIVPTQPGSQADAVARAISDTMGKKLGHPVVVENIAGAGGVPGTQQIVRAPKDGFTLGLISSNHVINPFIYKSLPYDALKDITPITVVGTLALVLVVNPSVEAKTTGELIALLKSKPGELNYGSSGNGTVLHLAGQLFLTEAGANAKHIPYKGAGNYTTDLLSGQVQLGFLTVPAVLPLIKAGKLRAIAVSTPERVPMLPDLPTLAESGLPRYSFDAWLAIVGPAGMDKRNVDDVQGKIKATLEERAVRDSLANQGVVIVGSGPAEAAPFLKRELDKHGRIVRQAGATLN